MADMILRKPMVDGAAGKVTCIEEFRKARPAGRTAGGGAFWNVVFAVLCLLVLVCVFYR